jgi:hypothetical protein
VLAFVCLMVPTVGSFYPAPAWPINLFPYIFLGYMLLGGARLYWMHRVQPAALSGIQLDLERALDASAHEIALSEEEHQHHLHTPGHGMHPVPAAPVGATAVGVNMVSAVKRSE